MLRRTASLLTILRATPTRASAGRGQTAWRAVHFRSHAPCRRFSFTSSTVSAAAIVAGNRLLAPLDFLRYRLQGANLTRFRNIGTGGLRESRQADQFLPAFTRHEIEVDAALGLLDFRFAWRFSQSQQVILEGRNRLYDLVHVQWPRIR